MDLKQRIYDGTHNILLETLDNDIFTNIDNLDDFIVIIAGGYAIKHFNPDYNTRDVDIEIFAKPRRPGDINNLRDEMYDEHLRRYFNRENKAQIIRAIGNIGVKIIDIYYNKSDRSNTISINVRYQRSGGALISQSIIDIYFSNETTELHGDINKALGRQRRRAVPVYEEFPPYSIFKVLKKEWLINEKEIALEDINKDNKLGAKHKEKSWVNQLKALKPDSDVLKEHYAGFKFNRDAEEFAPKGANPDSDEPAGPGSGSGVVASGVVAAAGSDSDDEWHAVTSDNSSDDEWGETVTSFSGTSGSPAGYDGDDEVVSDTTNYSHPNAIIVNDPITPKKKKSKRRNRKKKRSKKKSRKKQKTKIKRKKRKSRRKTRTKRK